jgi:dihydrofolate reductase
MKIILYNAVSIDGYIAKLDGDSDWVSAYDTPHFKEEINKSDCIVVGKNTFEQFEGESFPIIEKLNIVMTHGEEKTSNYDNVIYSNGTPTGIIKLAQEKGFNTILLVGGGKMNGSWLSENLVDEIVVDIHPIMFGSGIKMCESDAFFRQFTKVSLTELEGGLTLIRYKVVSKSVE